MKRIALITITLLITACTAAPKNSAKVTTKTDSRGQVLEKTVTLNADNYIDLETNLAIEQSRQAYFTAQKAQFENVTDATAQVSITAIQALSKPPSFGTNSNDLKTVQSQEATKRWQIGGNLLGQALGIYLTGKGGGHDKPTIQVNGNGNDLRSVVGDNNQYQYTETLGGIPLSPATVNPIELGSPEPEPESSED